MTAAVMAVTTLASAAYSAYEQRQAGKAEQQMYDLQAQEQKRQADLATERAGQEQVNADRDAQRRAMQLSQDIGAVYANAAGNGVLIDSGNVTSIANANRLEGQADIDDLLSKKNMEIWGHTQNAEGYTRQAGISSFQGRAAKQAGNRKAVGSGISAIGATASSFGSGMQIGNAINKRYDTHVW